MMEAKNHKKWWIIGCGGCLLVTLLMAIAIVLLAGAGVNSLKGASEGAVQDVFGAHFKPPAGYVSIGLPIGKLGTRSEVRNIVLLVNGKEDLSVIAIDKTAGRFETDALGSHNPAKVDDYMKRSVDTLIAESGRSSSSSKLNDMQFSGGTQFVPLANGKKIPCRTGVAEMSHRGRIVYGPAVVALVPEASNRVVSLLMLGGNHAADGDAQNDFSSGQKDIEARLIQIIQDSDLDDRVNY
jgi:hypothetical protein